MIAQERVRATEDDVQLLDWAIRLNQQHKDGLEG